LHGNLTNQWNKVNAGELYFYEKISCFAGDFLAF